jgi:hypothetical protein
VVARAAKDSQIAYSVRVAAVYIGSRRIAARTLQGSDSKFPPRLSPFERKLLL